MEKEYNRFVRPGIIEGFAGPMMSGKTRKLLLRVDPLRWMNEKFSYIGFKSKLNNRKFNCRSFEDFIDWNYSLNSKEILMLSKNYDLVAID